MLVHISGITYFLKLLDMRCHIIIRKEGLSTNNRLCDVENRLNYRSDHPEIEAVLRGAERMNLKNGRIYVL